MGVVGVHFHPAKELAATVLKQVIFVILRGTIRYLVNPLNPFGDHNLISPRNITD